MNVNRFSNTSYCSIPRKILTHEKPYYAQRFLSDFEVEHTISGILQKSLHPIVYRYRYNQIVMNIYNKLDNKVSLYDLRFAIRSCVDAEVDANSHHFAPISLSQNDIDVIVLDAENNEVEYHQHVGGVYRGHGSVVIYCGVSTLVEDSSPGDSLETLAYKCKYIHKQEEKKKKEETKPKKEKKSKKREFVGIECSNIDIDVSSLFSKVDELKFDSNAVEEIERRMSEINSKSRFYDSLMQLKAKVQLGLVDNVRTKMGELEAKYGKAYDTYKPRRGDVTESFAPHEQQSTPTSTPLCGIPVVDIESSAIFQADPTVCGVTDADLQALGVDTNPEGFF